MGQAEFSVYWWDADDGQHRELQFVEAQRAVERAHTLTNGPASRLGIVKKVMITDGLDFCVFLWEDGKVKYPSEDLLEEARVLRRRDA
jgi:hypothetical protein